MGSSIVRYTLLRFLIFFGCLLVAWLAGLRNDKVLLVLVSAAASVVVSFVLLRGMRDDMTQRIIDRQQRRLEDGADASSEAGGASDGTPDRAGAGTSVARRFMDGVDAEEDSEIDRTGRD